MVIQLGSWYTIILVDASTEILARQRPLLWGGYAIFLSIILQRLPRSMPIWTREENCTTTLKFVRFLTSTSLKYAPLVPTHPIKMVQLNKGLELSPTPFMPCSTVPVLRRSFGLMRSTTTSELKMPCLPKIKTNLLTHLQQERSMTLLASALLDAECEFALLDAECGFVLQESILQSLRSMPERAHSSDIYPTPLVTLCGMTCPRTVARLPSTLDLMKE